MKNRFATLVAVLAILALSLLAPHPERRPDQPTAMEAKGIVLFTHGDTIWKVTDKRSDELRSEGLSIGYKFWYGGLFWIDFLTSDGTFCLFKGDTYQPITEAEAEQFAGEDLASPFLYRWPLGWLIVGALAVLMVASKLLSGAKTKAGSSDLIEALRIVESTIAAANATTDTERSAAIEKGIAAGTAHLVNRGMTKEAAQASLLAAMQAVASESQGEEQQAS